MTLLPSNVVFLLFKEFGQTCPRTFSREEQRLAGELIRLLKEASIHGFDLELSDEIHLQDHDEHDEEFLPYRDYEEDGGACKSKSNLTFGGEEISEANVKSAVEYYRETRKGTRALSSMTKTFSFIKTETDIRKLREYERDGEYRMHRAEAYKKIANLLLIEVNRLLKHGIIFHDLNLQQLAMKINNDNKIWRDFKASHSWIQTFKKNCGLVSRHITKFYSLKNFANKDAIDDSGKKFVETVRQDMKKWPNASFCNADQSGFLKELHTARSLAPLGCKKVERVVQSQAATTHSYTIMPILYSDGTLAEKLFVQLQEPGGVFPQKGHYQAHNLEVRAGSSHIMTKNTMKEWVSSCLFSPASPTMQYLIVDSWSSFKDHQSIYQLVPSNKKLKVVNIPPGATGMVQPLDVFFFRPFKGMVKKITDYIIVHNVNISIYTRDNILKMMSLIYHQFTSPCFRSFLQYSWHKAGYLDNHPGKFETPVERCFSMADGLYTCIAPNCSESKFILCARCDKNFCFSHFFVVGHFC